MTLARISPQALRQRNLFVMGSASTLVSKS
jgi:hypothetical protein